MKTPPGTRDTRHDRTCRRSPIILLTSLQKTVAGVMIRVWSEKDLERAKKYREERYYQRP
jgi:hypothetical protein